MGEYKILIERDKKLLRKLNSLLDDIESNGNSSLGHPEPLKYGMSGWWSREIDKKNRLIYRIMEDGRIEIMGCLGHYDDK